MGKMHRTYRTNLLLMGFSLLVTSSICRAETLELVTYYPAGGAAGGDQQDRSLRVGDATGPAPGNGVAVIQNRVGIGIPAPAGGTAIVPVGALEVRGAAGQADRSVFLAGAGGTLNVGIGTNDPQSIFQVGDTLFAVQADQGGSLELGGRAGVANTVAGGTPYLDFHFGTGAAQDFNARIINTANDRLSIFTSADTVNPTLTVNGARVGIGTAAPSASATLGVASTTKGFLPPRMTTAQRDAIAGPVAGLMVYNTSTNQLNFYNGTVWASLADSARGITQVVFANAGTTEWMVPAGVTGVTIEVWGGGGGGGGATGGRWSHGGGGGGYGRQLATVTPGTILTVTVGAGGTGFPVGSTSNGTNGGTSSVTGMDLPASISATGGIGGLGNGNTSYNINFNGGGTSIATYNITGGRGTRIYGVVTSEGGDAGNGGAGGVAMVNAGLWFRASPGVAPGGGGSGQWDYVNPSGNNNGAVGRVVITY